MECVAKATTEFATCKIGGSWLMSKEG